MIHGGEKQNKCHKLLTVDDDEEMLNIIKTTLEGIEDIEIKVTTASEPELGLELLESDNFDIVLSDHRMPSMSGIELLSIVRKKYPTIIRALITAYSELDLAKDAINRANVDLYIEKPWTRDKIRKDIKNILKSFDTEQSKKIDLEEGNAYLFKEKKPKMIYEIGLERIDSEGEVVIVSRVNRKRFERIYDLESLEVDYYWLSKMAGNKTLDPINLELIADMIIRYYENGGKTVIFDGLESLLKDNSFKRFEGFLDNIVDVVSIEEGIFLTGLDPRTISERELATIEKKMISYSFESG